jgi:hypothetical protein
VLILHKDRDMTNLTIRSNFQAHPFHLVSPSPLSFFIGILSLTANSKLVSMGANSYSTSSCAGIDLKRLNNVNNVLSGKFPLNHASLDKTVFGYIDSNNLINKFIPQSKLNLISKYKWFDSMF